MGISTSSTFFILIRVNQQLNDFHHFYIWRSTFSCSISLFHHWLPLFSQSWHLLFKQKKNRKIERKTDESFSFFPFVVTPPVHGTYHFAFYKHKTKITNFLPLNTTGGHLIEFHLIESLDRNFLIKQAFDWNCVLSLDQKF